MKTKLTLTVRKNALDNARRQSRKTGKSISQLFEEIFESEASSPIKTEAQHSAERLLKTLRKAKPVKTLDDKTLLKQHVGRKFT